MFNDVKEFHSKFELKSEEAKEPSLLSGEMSTFRIKFLKEELTEYINSAKTGDLEGCFDALIDLVYVALGTAAFHGFPFEEGWKEVHKSNMQKIRVKNIDNSKRKSQYDVVKPKGWQHPNLSKILNEKKK